MDINTELFEGWVCEFFIHNAVPRRPLLWIATALHYQPDLVKFARQHDIIMLCLSCHTSHASKPLDCGVFKPLKSKWTNVCHTFFQNTFSQAWLRAVNPALEGLKEVEFAHMILLQFVSLRLKATNKLSHHLNVLVAVTD